MTFRGAPATQADEEDSDLEGAASRSQGGDSEDDEDDEGVDGGACAAGVAAAFDAAARNDIQRVSALLHAGVICVDDRGEDGTTLLHSAASRGYNRLVQVLARTHEADVDASDLRGNTPCHAAALAGHMKLVRLLCRLGADDGKLNGAGMSCYDFVQRGPVRGLRARVGM